MQTVSSEFNTLADGDIRPHSWGSRISFTKEFNEDVTFFTLDESMLDGNDILSTGGDNPIQAWDLYEYEDFTERILNFSIKRELEFPYSVVSSIADFTLNNYDGYFTPNSTSPIAPYILPKRPVRLLQGMQETLLPQFVGLTQGMPDISDSDGMATFTAMDFLTQIFDMPIRSTRAMADVTTDEVLAEIFDQFGLAEDQYSLGKGRNIIKFLFFEKDQLKAGDVIRPLMQAEGGMLWLNEEGIIRFRPRLELPEDSIYQFDEDSIVSLDVVDKDQIINHVTISTDVREVQRYQTIYSKKTSDTKVDVVQGNGTYVFKADLQDPLLDAIAPNYGVNNGVSWFTASRPGGIYVSSGVSVLSTELKTNTYEITIQNTNNFAINIDRMNLFGQPAKRISVEPIVYENKDTDSISKFEDRPLEITNNFIQDVDSARSLALSILNEYSEYANIIRIEVKGNAALQLSDIISVDYKQYNGDYRIIDMNNTIQGGKFTQILTCRAYQGYNWFVMDQSTLDGTDLLAP